MFKPVEPTKQRHGPPVGMDVYVRITPRLFYISSGAMKLWGEQQTCNISIDAPGRVMVISPNGSWKLSTVCETKHARRIETRNSTISFLDAGFPKALLGKYLPCHVDMAGALVVSMMVDYDRMEGKGA